MYAKQRIAKVSETGLFEVSVCSSNVICGLSMNYMLSSAFASLDDGLICLA